MPNPIEDYVQQNLPYAQQVEQKYGIPSAVTLAQGSIESGNGKHVVGGNLFGIKGHGVKTTDTQTGAPIEQAAYSSPEQAHDSYGKFLTENSRYSEAFKHKDDPKAFAAEVAKAGYSEKPEEYGKALDQTIDNINDILENHKPVKSGKIVLSPMQRQSLIDNGTDPDEYQTKINKDIDKGGDSYEKAYRSYSLLNDASQTPAQKAGNDFNYKIAGTPTNQFINSWGDDFMKSWVNGWSKAVNGLKTAGEEGLAATGLESKETFEQHRQQNLKDLSQSSLTLSPDANKDALNNPRAFIASVGNMAGTMVPLVAANLLGTGVSLFTANPEIEAGIGAATIAINPIAAGTSAVVGGLQFTGEAYNTAREKGLNHEQALTYSMIVGPAVGALGAFPVGELAQGVWKAARGAIADNAITTILDGNLSTAAFRDAQAGTTSSVAQMLASHAKNFGRVATKDAIAGAAFNTVQGGMNDLADHLYGTGDPTKDEAKELFKDALQGAMFGALFSAPAFMHGASNESLYGFIDRNQAKPEKLAAIKEYANKIATDKGSTPEQVEQTNGVIDEMHTVATKYGATIKDPDARYQIWQFGKESQQAAGDSQVIDHKLQELDGLNPTVAAPDKAVYEEIKALNGQKEQLINEQLTKIGSSKKPVNFAEYEQGKKAIQAQIDEKIKGLAGGEAVEEKPVAPVEEKQPDPFEQKPAESATEPVEHESDLDKLFGTGKAVAPKTVKDVLDVPITMGGTKGFLSMREDGGIDFTTDKGKVHNIANKADAEKTLAKDFDAIGIQPEDVDQFQLRNKMDAERKAEEVKPETEEEKAFNEFLDNPTKEEPNGTAVTAESERIATEEPETAQDFERLDKVVEDGAKVRKGRGKKGVKKQTESIGREDNENVASGEQSTPAQGTEGETTTAAQGDKNEADNKGTESNEPVKEDNGDEVESFNDFLKRKGFERRYKSDKVIARYEEAGSKRITPKEYSDLEAEYETTKPNQNERTTITIKSEDSKHTVEVKMKAKAKEATAEAKDKGISLKEQKDDLVGKMQAAHNIIKDETEITKAHLKEFKKIGVEFVKGATDGESRLKFKIIGDGEVSVSAYALPDTLEMTKKEFPENEKQAAVKYGKGTGGKLRAMGKYDTVESAKQSFEDAKENLETAKKSGNKAQIETYEKQLALEKEQHDTFMRSLENKKETIKTTEELIKRGKIDSAYRVQEMLELPELKAEVAQLEGKEYAPEKPDYELAKKVLEEERVKALEKVKTAQGPYLKKDGLLKTSIPEGVRRNLNSYDRELANINDQIFAANNEIPYKPKERYQKENSTNGKPLEKATVSLIDRALKKAFPNIKTSFLTGEEFDAKHVEGSGIGVTNPDGTVDINTDKVTAQTQVHEMGHVWTSWAKKFQPELYRRGMELASKETGIHEAIKADGYDLEGNALHEETLARMIGEAGEKEVAGLKEPTGITEKAKAWVGEMWDKLKGYVKNKFGIKDNRFDNLKDLPFNQFAGEIARHLVAGKEISSISSEEVAGIERDGVSAYGIGDSKRYMKVFETSPGSKSIPISDIKIDEDPESPLSEKQKNDLRIAGRLITETSETGSTVSDNVAKDVVDTNNFTPFQSKYLALASKNKWTKNAYLKVQKAMLSISSPGTWAYAIAGNDGMFWKAYEALNTGQSLGFRYKDDNLKLIKPLLDFANEGREKTLEHTKGDNLKILFPANTTVPDDKIAHFEQIKLHGLMQQPRYMELLDKGEGLTVMLSNKNFEERKRVKFTVYKSDFEALEKQFTPEQIKLMNEARAATSDAMWKQENPAFRALNGIDIDKFDKYEGELNIQGHEDDVDDFILKSTTIENVAHHKETTPSADAVYLIDDPSESWERGLDQGSKYAGMAVPIRNTDVLMGYARQNMVDLEMEHYINYWNKKKHIISNPEPPVSAVERFLVNNFSTATIGLNPLVDLKHLTTFPLASGYVPLKYTMSSLGDVAESYVSLVKNLDPLNTGKPKNYTPLLQECLKDNYFFLRYKSGIDESQIRLKGDKFSVPMYKEGRWQMVDFADKASAMVFLKTLETATGTGLWSGAKKKVRAEMPHLTEGTPEFTEQVSKLYRDGITASQPSFNSVNRPLYMDGAFDKTRGVLNKTVSMFAGQPFAAFNETIKRGMGMLSDPTPKTRFNFAKSLTHTLIVNALIVSGINLVRQKTIGSDKDKETLAGGTLRAALGSLPVIGPPLEIVYGKVERGAQGYDLNYPATEVVNDMAKTIAHAITGKESQAAKESMRIVPQLLGIPATPFKFGAAAVNEVTK